MLEQRSAIFLVNLLQDLNVLRPLIHMASRDFRFDVLLLVSPKFRGRDALGIWEAELARLQAEASARVLFWRDEFEAFQQLDGSGIIFSASESNLPEHEHAHSIFRLAPSSYLKVTLQHGFECVGFRHNAAHDRAYGQHVSFGADLICSWQPPDLQRALAPSQRPKVIVTGPTAVLQAFSNPAPRRGSAGLVCENLHSVRLGASGELRGQFVSTFEQFCGLQGQAGEQVVLRPHPGGQYALRHDVKLPENVTLNNAPMYRLDLRQFPFGISAPSSVLVDMLLADIPTAVWKDPAGGVDVSNYAGLTMVSTAEDWQQFAVEARSNPADFVRRQRRFLAEQQMPIEAATVYARYAKLFHAAQAMHVRAGRVEKSRLLIVANAHLPTVQVCLERPLEPLIRTGELATRLLTEDRLKRLLPLSTDEPIEDLIEDALLSFGPDAVIFSRYSGPNAPAIVDWAQRAGVPTIYHIDDDLLAVPPSLGEAKHAYHNDPARLSTVRYLLQNVDLVYASTEVLQNRLKGRFPDAEIVAGPINCSGRVMRKPASGTASTIGYMASADHLPNLEMVLPAIIQVLDQHPGLRLELFGSIPIPPDLKRFGERVASFAPVGNYDEFLDRLGSREWDIGICPLVPTEFNRAKSNNKWVEYVSLGVAPIASAGTVYDDCCSAGCGVLADTLDEWTSALERLVQDDGERIAIVERAQRKLESEYGIAQHRQQILDTIQLAADRVKARRIKDQA